MALIASVRFVLLYADPDPPTTAESLPPIRTLNGEKNVDEPPPELASPAAAAVYSKLRGVGTAVIWNVPLYPATPTPAIVTQSPTERPCASKVRIVAVVPDSLAPGALSVTVPPPEVARPAVGFVNWNERDDGTAV